MARLTYYRSQIGLALGLNKIVDAYWNGEFEESDFADTVKAIVNNNKDKLYKEDDFTSLLSQRCGKKRLTLITKILENTN